MGLERAIHDGIHAKLVDRIGSGLRFRGRRVGNQSDEGPRRPRKEEDATICFERAIAVGEGG